MRNWDDGDTGLPDPAPRLAVPADTVAADAVEGTPPTQHTMPGAEGNCPSNSAVDLPAPEVEEVSTAADGAGVAESDAMGMVDADGEMAEADGEGSEAAPRDVGALGNDGNDVGSA